MLCQGTDKMKIELTEENGTYHLDVDILTPGFAGLVRRRLATTARMWANACGARSLSRGPRVPKSRNTPTPRASQVMVHSPRPWTTRTCKAPTIGSKASERNPGGGH